MTLLARALCLALIASAAVPSHAARPASGGSLLYNSIPVPVPGNVISQGFECCSVREFGDEIELAGPTQRAQWVEVLLSSWGCESGGWPAGTCVTTPGATFRHPITLNLYAVDESGPENAPGALIASVTQEFDIPYRPSASPECTDGRWYDADDDWCYNGYATPIRFDIQSLRLDLPRRVILAVAFNTTHHGYAPIGEGAACFHEDGGCGYDSLNVGADDNGVGATAGIDVEPDTAYANFTHAGFYCDGGAGGVSVFRRDAGCWLGYSPTFAVGVGRAPRR